jgi:hypothetical protein
MAPRRTTTPPGATGSGGTGGPGNPGMTGATDTAPDPTTTTSTTAGTTAGTTGTTTPTGSTTNPTAGTTAQDPTSAFTPIIAKIIRLCDFPNDSTMVEYMEQQEWTMLHHVTTIPLDEVKDFYTVRVDGHFKAKPMAHHLRLFKCFLLFYKRKCRDLVSTLTEDDVIHIAKKSFQEYCGSTDYFDDLAAGDGTPQAAPASVKADPNAGGIVGSLEALTVQEFRRGVKRDKTHYEDLKDDKYFNTWNRGFVATAHMHHTHHVLDATYVPQTDVDVAVFKEMQTFMYAVLEDHLKTDKGKSLVSHYEATRDAQSIYRELKKHALSSTAAQLSGDTLLQYITTARFPGNWRGTSYGFVLHWKEQVMRYEKLELEAFPSKQKLRMLQNAVGDVTELAYVKQIGDQDIARGNPPLSYESYMELLLSACSTYDKKVTLPGKHKRAVYAADTSIDDVDYRIDDVTDGKYDVFQVDTEVADIMAFATDTNRFGKPHQQNPKASTSRVPR